MGYVEVSPTHVKGIIHTVDLVAAILLQYEGWWRGGLPGAIQSLPSCQSTKQLQPIRRHNVLHENPTVAALFCQQAIKALPSLISCMVSFDVKQR